VQRLRDPTPPFVAARRQVVNNLVMLPGSIFVSPTTYFRMHAVYLGQAIKVGKGAGTGPARSVWLFVRCQERLPRAPRQR
jgi:hypothetical protein